MGKTKWHKKIIRYINRILIWFILFVAVVLAIVDAVLLIPAVQNKIADIAVNQLDKKIENDISLERLRITLPNIVVIRDLYVEDRIPGDTLLRLEKLKVNIDILKLLQKEVSINDVELVGTSGKIWRAANDSVLNLQYFINQLSDPSKTKNEQDTQPKQEMKLSVNDVHLQDIQFQYLDSLNQLYLTTSIGKFDTKINRLDYKQLTFDVQKLRLKDSQTSLQLAAANQTNNTSNGSSKNVIVKVDQFLELDNVSYVMADTIKKISMETKAGILRVESANFNLDEQQVTYGNIKINQSNFSNIQYPSARQETNSQNNSSGTTNQWQISGGAIEMENNRIVLSNKNHPVKSNKFDPNHLDIQLRRASLDDVTYAPSEIKGSIKTLAAAEGNGMVLRNLTGDFTFGNKSITASNVAIKTNNSQIFPVVNISYPSRNAFFNLSENIDLQVTLKPSVINVADISYFIDAGEKSMQQMLPFDHVELRMQANGKLANLNLQNLQVKTASNTQLKMQGQISGIPDIEKANLNLQIDTLHTVYEDYQKLMNSTNQNSNLQMPVFISGKGQMKGSLYDIMGDVQLHTKNGSLNLRGSYTQDTTTQMQRVSGEVNIPQFDLGYYLNDTATFQNLTMNASLQATLMENSPTHATAKVSVPTVEYLHYPYNGITLDATYQNDSAYAKLVINDENFRMNGDFDGRFHDSLPALAASIVLEQMNAQKLNMTQNNILAKGKINADVKGLHPDSINGYLNITDVLLLKDQRRFSVDSFLVKATNDNNYSKFTISSPLLAMDYEGSLKATELPKALASHVNHYFQIPGLSDSTNKSPGKYFDLTTEIYDAEIFTEVLVPGLKNFKPGRLEIHFDSDDNKLNASVNFPEILFYNVQIDSLLLTASSNDQRIRYATKLKKAGIEQFWLQNFNVSGNISDNLITNRFTMTEKDSVKYFIKSTLRSEPEKLTGKLSQDSLILDFEPWKVPKSNSIVIANRQFNFTDFTITRDGQKGSVITREDDNVKKTTLSFNNFNAKTIGNIITAKKPLVHGLMTGETTVWFDPGPAFTSDLNVQDLAFLEEPIGNLSFFANNVEAQNFNVNISLTGRNELSVKGSYQSGDSQQINLTTDFTDIQLATIQPFVSTNVDELKGVLTGNLSVSGQFADPSIQGTINLDNVEVIPTYLNTLLTVNEGAITVDDELIRIETFQMRDANNNSATLSGSVNFDQLTNPELDVVFNSTNFLLLNTEDATVNETYYGTVIADLRVEALGRALSPQLDVNVEVLEGTDFTYIVKPQSPATIEKSGLVEFAGQDTVTFEINPTQNRQDTTPGTLQGIGLQANVELNPEATIHIQLDPISEEQMTLNGSANLSLKRNINGELSLVGRYEIQQGIYELKLYEVLRREFSIEEGSYISWRGDLLNPTADLTAVYVVETSPGDLAPEIDATIGNRPFYVNLNISEELLSPNFSFELEVPPSLRGSQVEAIIQNINQDESRLNQQVFSLLLFQSFMSEQMLGGSDFNQQLTSTAREGLNNLLSDQLTRFAEMYIEGFDIDLDIDSYGQMDETDNGVFGNTQVQLNVSKSLFDERLTVSVGSNVTLAESPKQQVAGTQNTLIGDISIEYKLTPDGIWRVRGFNKTEYEDVIDGEVTKTGVSILYNRNFYRFSDLFKKKEDPKLSDNQDEE